MRKGKRHFPHSDKMRHSKSYPCLPIQFLCKTNSVFIWAPLRCSKICKKSETCFVFRPVLPVHIANLKRRGKKNSFFVLSVEHCTACVSPHRLHCKLFDFCVKEILCGLFHSLWRGGGFLTIKSSAGNVLQNIRQTMVIIYLLSVLEFSRFMIWKFSFL